MLICKPWGLCVEPSTLPNPSVSSWIICYGKAKQLSRASIRRLQLGRPLFKSALPYEPTRDMSHLVKREEFYVRPFRLRKPSR